MMQSCETEHLSPGRSHSCGWKKSHSPLEMKHTAVCLVTLTAEPGCLELALDGNALNCEKPDSLWLCSSSSSA